jgi:hypothetical protein
LIEDEQRAKHPVSGMSRIYSRLGRKICPLSVLPVNYIQPGVVVEKCPLTRWPRNWFAPPGSNRSGSRGNEAVGAFDGKGRMATPRACRPHVSKRPEKTNYGSRPDFFTGKAADEGDRRRNKYERLIDCDPIQHSGASRIPFAFLL